MEGGVHMLDRNGLPEDKSFMELDLPEFLQESIDLMKKYLNKEDPTLTYDFVYPNLYADINDAEICNIISTEQAWYLREKYLGLKYDEIYGGV